jgi:hypothetical protein
MPPSQYKPIFTGFIPLWYSRLADKILSQQNFMTFIRLSHRSPSLDRLPVKNRTCWVSTFCPARFDPLGLEWRKFSPQSDLQSHTYRNSTKWVTYEDLRGVYARFTNASSPWPLSSLSCSLNWCLSTGSQGQPEARAQRCRQEQGCQVADQDRMWMSILRSAWLLSLICVLCV